MTSPNIAPRLFERVRLLSVRPEGLAHAAAFDDLITGLAAAFAALGSHVDIAHNAPLLGEGVNFVFGAHLIPPGGSLPPNSVIVNLEQFRSGMFARQKHYVELLKRHPVIDYSPRNAELIREQTGNPQVFVFKVGMMPVLSRIAPAAQQDVDVLFYGVPNERRQKIVDGLVAAGLKVHTLPGIYGNERDQWIARSKVVLNVHFYDDKIHEIIRSSYLLANRKVVVSECDDATEIDADVRDAIAAVPYDRLVQTCVDLVRDESRRRALEQAGFERFAQRDQSRFLAELLPQLSRPLPASINLGSGKDFKAEHLNIDIDPKWSPDILGDLSAAAGLQQIFCTRRFGVVRLDPAQFDQIITTDVLEHVPDLVALMTRCLQLLRPGGTMRIGVPYDLSWGAWQDPTHIRAFNERSWLYYTDWHWYLGWLEARFDVAELQMQLSPVGEELRRRGLDPDEIYRTPRAVDSMQVVLRKRPLSAAEKQQAMAWLGARSTHASAPSTAGGQTSAPG